MRILVTGSSGHLGEGLVRTLSGQGHDVVGVDVLPSVHTDYVGSIVDPTLVRRCVEDVDAVLHTATLHKPHVATHTKQEFVDTNITGTLNLLEEASRVGVKRFVFTRAAGAWI
ncbi:MAG: NAD(P)-dependent oxidoreductase [Nannocystaceae bacterium]|nr:NAD(P)-dependent oxidoreductase [Nannocystaceae bacterium]